MALVELKDYCLPPLGSGDGISGVDLSLAPGEKVSVEADNPDDARLLLRALATLASPAEGSFRFAGRRLDFSDYRKLLPIKRRIGYVAAEAALLSNRTLRQNLLTMRYYFENALSISLDPETEALCNLLGIDKKLERLPAQVDSIDIHTAVAVREVGKNPDLLLFDRPEETIGAEGFRRLLERTGAGPPEAQTWICATRDRHYLTAHCSRRIRIRNGALGIDPLPERDRTGG